MCSGLNMANMSCPHFATMYPLASRNPVTSLQSSSKSPGEVLSSAMTITGSSLMGNAKDKKLFMTYKDRQLSSMLIISQKNCKNYRNTPAFHIYFQEVYSMAVHNMRT